MADDTVQIMMIQKAPECVPNVSKNNAEMHVWFNSRKFLECLL